jgi:hypothetical protein
MKQRSFPWMQAVQAPQNAPQHVVAQCASYAQAARVALLTKPGGPWSDAWLAGRLGITRGYLSLILSGQKPFPRWMLQPVSFATGSRLVQQYDDLQRALRITDAPTQRDIVQRLAAMAMAA